jgi:hypothetical protein
MVKPRKRARQLTTDEALKRIFGKQAAKRLRELADNLPPPGTRRKSLKKKAKDDDD